MTTAPLSQNVVSRTSPLSPLSVGDAPATHLRLLPSSVSTGALWVWDDLAGDGLSPRSILAKARRTGANTVYVNAFPLTEDSLATLEAFIRTAMAQQLRVELLVGSPEWIESGTRSWIQANILAPITALIDELNLGGDGDNWKLALHLDVEPHTSGELTPSRMCALVDMLTFFREATAGVCALHVDLPAWYSTLSLEGKPYVDELLRQVDQVTLMAYATSLDGVIAGAKVWLQAAAATQTKVVIGVEVGPEYQAVGLHTQRGVAAATARLQASFADPERYPAYAGIALHDLGRVSRLPVGH